jgi:hypothetical protein
MAVGELLVQVAVLHRDLVQGADQCFDVAGSPVGQMPVPGMRAPKQPGRPAS